MKFLKIPLIVLALVVTRVRGSIGAALVGLVSGLGFALVSLIVFMNAVVRKYDVPCRYGGEEFTVILPSTDAEGAMHEEEEFVGGHAHVLRI